MKTLKRMAGNVLVSLVVCWLGLAVLGYLDDFWPAAFISVAVTMFAIIIPEAVRAGDRQRLKEAIAAEACRAIEFASKLDELEVHDFLNGWLQGDLSEFPEFNSVIPHAHMERD